MNQTTDTIERIERAVLSALIVDESSIWKVTLSPDAFSNPNHTSIYNAIVDLHKHELCVDALSICDWLEKHNQLDKAGSEYVRSLQSDVVDVDKVEDYAKLVSDAAGNRNLTKLAIDMAGKLRDGSFNDNYSEMQARLLKLAPANTSQFKTSEELALDVLLQIRMRYDDPTDCAGIRTGYRDFDRKFSGFLSGMHVVQGRTSSGKTWFALGLAEGVAGYKVPVAFISFEMSDEQIMYRRISRHSHVAQESLRTGKAWYQDSATARWLTRNLSKEEQNRIELAYDEVQGIKLFTYSGHGSTSSDVRAWLTRMKAQHGIGFAVVDYIQKMNDKAENQELSWGRAAHNLKETADSLQIPVLVLSQVSRDVKKNADRFLDLGDARGSGQIDEATDVLYSITSKDYEKKNDPAYKRTYIVEVGCAKDRLLGHAGRMIELSSDPITGAIENIEEGKRSIKD